MKLTLPALFLLVPVLAAAQSPLERNVLEEMNHARTVPAEYARNLQEYRKKFRGKTVAAGPVRIVTREGVAAVDEAILFLRTAKPLPPLEYSKGLSGAAAELVREEGEKGTVGHTGERSGGMTQRVERHGKWEGSVGENLSYGSDDARSVVMQLLIDDGVPGRGHRKNIFNPSFRKAGISCGRHPSLRTMCAIDFAGGFTQ